MGPRKQLYDLPLWPDGPQGYAVQTRRDLSAPLVMGIIRNIPKAIFKKRSI